MTENYVIILFLFFNRFVSFIRKCRKLYFSFDFLVIKELTAKPWLNLTIFFLVILYALSAVYFAGVMVRLMLTLTPVVCILSGIAFSGLLELFLREDDTPRSEDSDEDEQTQPNNRRLYDKVCNTVFLLVL